MVIDSWLVRIKSTFLSTTKSITTPTQLLTNSVVSSNVSQPPPITTITIGILSFEVAVILSKLLHLCHFLSDHHLQIFRRETISLPGTCKLVSDDETFLLSLARAEFTEALRLIATTISLVVSHRCKGHDLRDFLSKFHEFAETGHDGRQWTMRWREMEVNVKKMERIMESTFELHKEMEELEEMERSCGRLVGVKMAGAAAAEMMRGKINLKKQEVRRLKEESIWGLGFDSVGLILAKTAFTILARIKDVFQFSNHRPPPPLPPLPPRMPNSTSVYPSSDHCPISSESNNKQQPITGFLESNLEVLVPPPSTLGSAGLALRYATIILVIERMTRSPSSITVEARDNFYSMLPSSLCSKLRSRLRLVSGNVATDARLADEWQKALAIIIDWLVPLAHKTLRWQWDRSFGRLGGGGCSGSSSPATIVGSIKSGPVLMLQTLQFADVENTEAAVTEMLIGLNYIWRFDVEMAAKAKLEKAAKLPLLPPKRRGQ